LEDENDFTIYFSCYEVSVTLDTCHLSAFPPRASYSSSTKENPVLQNALQARRIIGTDRMSPPTQLLKVERQLATADVSRNHHPSSSSSGFVVFFPPQATHSSSTKEKPGWQNEW
jgi:hypothetical protein